MLTLYDKDRSSHLLPFALTAAVHLALVLVWQLARQPAPAEEHEREAMQWIWLQQAPRDQPSAAPIQRPSKPAPARPAVTAPPPAAGKPAEAVPASDTTVSQTTRLIDQLAQAKAGLGRIDAEIANERRGLISAPKDSPQLRMHRKMAEAAELAPNKWYQAPKVTEIIDPGGYGRRRYKVISGLGTYCITVESNHAPDGLDTMKNGIRPKTTTCPKYEQPATRQEW